MIIRISTIIMLKILALLLVMPAICYAQFQENNFYDDEGRRHRGWIWFEQEVLEDKQKQHREMEQNITPEEARQELEKFKQEMDDKRAIMMTRPSAESVRAYMEMEEKMWKDAFALENAQREAKFKYPDLFDKLKEPTNVHAVKFKRGIEGKEKQAKVMQFAEEFDLVLFSKEDCLYCHEFAPVLKHFSEKYGFNTEEISMGGPMTGLFKGKAMPELGMALGIESTPTVVAVSKNGKHAFELIRGFVTVSELEEYSGLALEYSNQLSAKSYKEASKKIKNKKK